MTSPTLLSLADRCEKLTGPCRETDALIAMAVGLKDKNYWPWQSLRPKDSPLRPEINFWKHLAPAFTASLDAAMTLVPEGWDFCLSVGVGEPAQVGMSPAGKVAEVEADAATPALALTAASLRARSALEASRG